MDTRTSTGCGWPGRGAPVLAVLTGLVAAILLMLGGLAPAPAWGQPPPPTTDGTGPSSPTGGPSGSGSGPTGAGSPSSPTVSGGPSSGTTSAPSGEATSGSGVSPASTATSTPASSGAGPESSSRSVPARASAQVDDLCGGFLVELSNPTDIEQSFTILAEGRTTTRVVGAEDDDVVDLFLGFGRDSAVSVLGPDTEPVNASNLGACRSGPDVEPSVSWSADCQGTTVQMRNRGADATWFFAAGPDGSTRAFAVRGGGARTSTIEWLPDQPATLRIGSPSMVEQDVAFAGTAACAAGIPYRVDDQGASPSGAPVPVLPFTGVSLMLPLAGGAALVVLGIGLVVAARPKGRRR